MAQRKQTGPDVIEGTIVTEWDCKFDSTRKGFFEGYASVFGNVDQNGDIVMAGAYADSIAKKERVPLLFNHWIDNLLGYATTFKEDDTGLRFAGRLTPGASMSDDIYAHMRAGALDGVSVGLRLQPGGAEWEGKVRKITHADLMEISMVIAPANKLARADLQTLKNELPGGFDLEEMESLADFEDYMRDACGLTRKQAKSMVARVRSIALRDADPAKAPEHKASDELLILTAAQSFFTAYAK
ncbi:HK97 family phage prohead protease [Cupriavidus taiwanensis]|uniref:HK97 family phage prohead protease n=1 Tax=Cupriavidus taiwanensis TaxID=164546 RepID=UPI000E1A343E|nr:HK97 family phage prohead protease [Cupriavidus taiwanensis]SPA17250.1 Phage prohead protease, HK97 family [Cupriavidus taiwanensis]